MYFYSNISTFCYVLLILFVFLKKMLSFLGYCNKVTQVSFRFPHLLIFQCFVLQCDAISILEKEHDYTDEHFDFIQSHIRKFCLQCILRMCGKRKPVSVAIHRLIIVLYISVNVTNNQSSQGSHSTT